MATAVERAKQVTMTELNAIIGVSTALKAPLHPRSSRRVASAVALDAVQPSLHLPLSLSLGRFLDDCIDSKRCALAGNVAFLGVEGRTYIDTFLYLDHFSSPSCASDDPPNY